MTEILSATGRVITVPEQYQDAVTAISGTGPAYLFFVVEAMRELSGDTRRQVITSGTAVMSREREVTQWVRSSRSAGSGWRRRSIASCSSAHGSSVAAQASSLRDQAP